MKVKFVDVPVKYHREILFGQPIKGLGKLCLQQ